MTLPISHVHVFAFLASLGMLALPATILAQQSQQIDVHRQFKIIRKDSAGKVIVREVPDTTRNVPAPSFDSVKVKQNWSRLQKGFSEQDVETLLGSPARVQYGEACLCWWYGDRAVIFNVVTHKVAGWDE